MALENTLVTVDALGCQKAIAQPLLEPQADCRLGLQANQAPAYEAVPGYCEPYYFQRGAARRLIFDAVDDSHGRRVRRRVFAGPAAAPRKALSDWPSLHPVLAIESIRSGNGAGKVEAEIRYFLSSFTGDPQVFAQAIRHHWSIENRLHGVLDVTFREDESRVRDPTVARHLALLRQRALNRLSQDRLTKGSHRAKRKKAAWHDDSRQQLLWG